MKKIFLIAALLSASMAASAALSASKVGNYTYKSTTATSADATWGQASNNLATRFAARLNNWTQTTNGVQYPYSITGYTGIATWSGTSYEGNNIYSSYNATGAPNKRGSYKYQIQGYIGASTLNIEGDFVIVQQGSGKLSVKVNNAEISESQKIYKTGTTWPSFSMSVNSNTNTKATITYTWKGISNTGTSYSSTSMPTNPGAYYIEAKVSDDFDQYLLGYTLVSPTVYLTNDNTPTYLRLTFSIQTPEGTTLTNVGATTDSTTLGENSWGFIETTIGSGVSINKHYTEGTAYFNGTGRIQYLLNVSGEYGLKHATKDDINFGDSELEFLGWKVANSAGEVYHAGNGHDSHSSNGTCYEITNKSTTHLTQSDIKGKDITEIYPSSTYITAIWEREWVAANTSQDAIIKLVGETKWKEHKISYKDESSSPEKDVTFVSGEIPVSTYTKATLGTAGISLPSADKVVAETGTTFVCWYEKVEVNIDNGDGTTTTQIANVDVTAVPVGSTTDKTYYAKWTKSGQTYKVNYVDNKPSDAAAAVQNMPTDAASYYNADTYTVSTQEPTLAGYTFVGWQDQHGKDMAGGSTGSIAGDDVYLHAQWKKDATVSFKVVGGTWDDGSDADKVVTGLKWDKTINGYKLSSTDIPTGMTPNIGYTATGAAWDKTPSADDVFTEEACTYTYTFKQVYYSVEIPVSVEVKKSVHAESAPAEAFDIEAGFGKFEIPDALKGEIAIEMHGDPVQTNGVGVYDTARVKLLFTMNAFSAFVADAGFDVTQAKGSADGWIYDGSQYHVYVSHAGSGDFKVGKIEIADGTAMDKVLFTNIYTVAVPDGTDDSIAVDDDDIIVQRYVHIPAIDGIATDPAAGYHYVSGHQNFTFTATFADGEPQKVFATGYYSGETIELEPKALDSGAYQYMLRQVTEPWEITFSAVPGSSGVGTEAISGETRIWSDGNALHISAASDTEAAVYSITGSIVKTLRLSAGEATEPLERGIYIVKTGGKAAKVVIR